MKKLLIALALAGTVSLSTTAGAEPRLAAAPAIAYDWSGLYIGIHGGSGTSHTTVTNARTLIFSILLAIAVRSLPVASSVA